VCAKQVGVSGEKELGAFLREVSALARLNHPGILVLLGVASPDRSDVGDLLAQVCF